MFVSRRLIAPPAAQGHISGFCVQWLTFRYTVLLCETFDEAHHQHMCKATTHQRRPPSPLDYTALPSPSPVTQCATWLPSGSMLKVGLIQLLVTTGRLLVSASQVTSHDTCLSTAVLVRSLERIFTQQKKKKKKRLARRPRLFLFLCLF